MADPLSITAGIAGIAASALHGTRILLDDIHKIKDAPTVIETLESDIHQINLTLQSLQGIPEAQWKALGKAVEEQSETAIRTCTDSCAKFREDLNCWKGHSDSKKLSFRRRVNMSLIKESHIKSMSNQLRNHQGTLNILISMANLSVASHTITFPAIVCVMFAND